jgi:LmbE family N-acetylglucosaminyl deacetylase
MERFFQTPGQARKTAAIVGPHPDDPEFTLAALARYLVTIGWRVCNLLLYAGHRCPGLKMFDLSPQDKGRIRLGEAQAAAGWTGAEVKWLNLDAYERPLYAPTPDDVELFTDTLGELIPGVVFVPSWQDPHVAHQAARHLLSVCLPRLAFHDVEIVTYPSAWTPLGGNTWPTHYFAYGHALADIKRAAIRAHQSQLAATNFLELAESDARAWALRLPELISHHQEAGIFDDVVGCEVFHWEVISSRHAVPDPVHTALARLAVAPHLATRSVRPANGATQPAAGNRHQGFQGNGHSAARDQAHVCRQRRGSGH